LPAAPAACENPYDPQVTRCNAENGFVRLYRLLTGPDDASFCHKVTAALDKGWHLYGSPTYAFDPRTNEMRCGQAVVKDVPGKDYQPGMKLSEQ
jgi:hypothetical protein